MAACRESPSTFSYGEDKWCFGIKLAVFRRSYGECVLCGTQVNVWHTIIQSALFTRNGV